MNVRRLRKVVKVILEHAAALDMCRWHGSKRGGKGFLDSGSTLAQIHKSTAYTHDDEPTTRKAIKKLIQDPTFYCTTNHCFAGFTNLAFFDLIDPRDDSEENATEILDLSDAQRKSLFYLNHWPRAFRTRYFRANKKDKASILAEFVEFFIKEEKKAASLLTYTPANSVSL